MKHHHGQYHKRVFSSSLSKKRHDTSSNFFFFWTFFFVICLGVMCFRIWRWIQSERSFTHQKKQFEHFLLSRKTTLLDSHSDSNQKESLFIQPQVEEEKVVEIIKQRLQNIYDPIESFEFVPGKKSYTLNKQKVYLCLKDEHGQYYHMNMLMYVALHELAHCLCEEVGHTPKFHAIFDSLLDLAHEKGIYNKFIEPITPYCEYQNSSFEKEDDPYE